MQIELNHTTKHHTKHHIKHHTKHHTKRHTKHQQIQTQKTQRPQKTLQI